MNGRNVDGKGADGGLVLVVLSSASGAGKTTLWHRLTSDDSMPGFHVSVSHTTRRPRGRERDGVDYHFVDRTEFERMLGADEFAEHAEVHGNLYGTSTAEIQRISRLDGARGIVFDIDVQGARQIVRRYPQACTVFILPPSVQELERRLRARGTESEDELRLRMDSAVREMQAFTEFDYIVVNDDLETAYRELVAIVRAHPLRTAVRGERARELLESWQHRSEP